MDDKSTEETRNTFDTKFEDLNLDYDTTQGGYQEDPNTAKEDKALVDPNATEPTNGPKGKNGGRRKGAGRPKGSKNQFSKHSVERLKELNFDPMLAMVELYHETSQIIAEMEDKNHPRRYSAPALASLMINKQKIVNDLMRYGYRFVPEKIEQEITKKEPFKVTLLGVKEEDVEDATVVTPEVGYKEVEHVEDKTSGDQNAEESGKDDSSP